MSEGKALKVQTAISKEDLDSIETMSKDDLESYVKQHFNFDMDKRSKASKLRADATKMIKDHLGLNEPEVKKTEVKKSKQPAALEFIKNPHDGNPYPSNPWANHYPDWERCDSSGKSI
jgi:hypothetical protein|tara:strand:- start:2298 stop:2651 length:354 start_codon:yes stop_codon:yes gene_type:complete